MEVMKKKSILKNSRFICKANEGTEQALNECKKLMKYQDYVIHAFKHHGVYKEGS